MLGSRMKMAASSPTDNTRLLNGTIFLVSRRGGGDGEAAEGRSSREG